MVSLSVSRGWTEGVAVVVRQDRGSWGGLERGTGQHTCMRKGTGGRVGTHCQAHSASRWCLEERRRSRANERQTGDGGGGALQQVRSFWEMCSSRPCPIRQRAWGSRGSERRASNASQCLPILSPRGGGGEWCGGERAQVGPLEGKEKMGTAEGRAHGCGWSEGRQAQRGHEGQDPPPARTREGRPAADGPPLHRLRVRALCRTEGRAPSASLSSEKRRAARRALESQAWPSAPPSAEAHPTAAAHCFPLALPRRRIVADPSRLFFISHLAAAALPSNSLSYFTPRDKSTEQGGGHL